MARPNQHNNNNNNGNNSIDTKTYKKLQKRQSRQIRSELNDPSLNKESILNVSDFLNSRNFEITELSKAQLNSKFASSSRIFQTLPRKLRRRTASHNVKRIPKRLRSKALREMNKNDTPTIKKRKLKGRELYRVKIMKNLLKIGSNAISKHHLLPIDSNLSLGKLKLRQRIKLLNKQLSFHHKNKTNTESSTLSFQTLNNSLGSYDNSSINSLSSPLKGKLKYIKRQRNYVWLNTHIWHAKRSHLIKRWGFQIPLKPTQKSFRLSHRNFNSSGSIIFDKSFINTLILESETKELLVRIVESILKDKLKPKHLTNGSILTRLIYDDEEVLGTATFLYFENNGTYRYVFRIHPSIYEKVFTLLLSKKPEDLQIHDTRFAIGSIDLIGPTSLPSLATVLKPLDLNSKESQFFKKLCCESNLPNNTVFTLQVKDPRLSNRNKPRPLPKIDIIDTIIELKQSGDSINPTIVENLLTREGRSQSYQNQKSLKEINKLKSAGQSIDDKEENSFPIILYKHKDIWTILVPWFWVLPTWHQLNHIAHVNHGGLVQTHQFQYEHDELFFPIDYPFTKVGYLENSLNSELKKAKHDSKPNSKKINFDKLQLFKNLPGENVYEIKGELGNPFGCDWRFLQGLKIGLNQLSPKELNSVNSGVIERTSSWDENLQRKIDKFHDVYEYIKDVLQNDQEAILSKRETPLPIRLLKSSNDTQISYPNSISTPLWVKPISIEMIGRGNPKDNARIYSIPPKDRHTWLNSINDIKPNGERNHPVLSTPHSKYLIGFITSGTFNLTKGKNSGVGCIDAIHIQNSSDTDQFCIVRNVETNHSSIAKWKEIKI